MSDEQAAKVEAEAQVEKTEEQKAAAAAQARLWIVSLMLDPETGSFAMQPNANVVKTWQLEAMLAQAHKQNTLNAHGRMTAEMFQAVLSSQKKPGLFGKK